jgi:hypothetical protein
VQAENPRKMLNAWIQPFEFRLVVQDPILVVSHHAIQLLFDVYNIDQVSMLVKRFSFDLQFHLVVMEMQLIFWSPISPD